MRRYERKLLDSLEGETNSNNSEQTLKNVRESMGSLGYMVGNPLTKTEITLQVRIQYFDNIAGIFLAPAALPGGQNSLPVYIFGLTDFHGGFIKSRLLSPLNPPWGWNAIAQPTIGIWNYTIFNVAPWTVNIADGDLVDIVFLNLPVINIIAIITVHCPNVAYGTFLNSFVSDLITINRIRCIVPVANVNQFLNPLLFGYQTLFGKVKTDTIDPRMYQLPSDFQNNIADIPLNLPIDKNLFMAFQLNFDCQAFDIVMFVEKVEPLTHKKYKIIYK